MNDYYLIAQITSVYKKAGYLKIKSYSDFPDRFRKLKKVYLEFFGNKKEFLVEDVLLVNGVTLLKFKNFNSDKDASFLLGKEVYITESELISLNEGEYFIHDLIGSKVYRNGNLFGTLTDVMKLPANDVYVIQDLNNNEILIPALKELILSFDPKTKVLVLTPGDDFYDEDEI